MKVHHWLDCLGFIFMYSHNYKPSSELYFGETLGTISILKSSTPTPENKYYFLY